MLQQKSFTFNPFAENTYILYDGQGQAAIIDPGCCNRQEEAKLHDFITEKNLKPVRLLLTHGHLDHILGNDFVFRKYGLAPYMNSGDLHLLHSLVATCEIYGLHGVAPSPEPAGWLNEGDTVTFGEIKLEVIFAPGHSPGSLCFYSAEDKKLWCGDVLFNQSIGRTDLPGGDSGTLFRSIRSGLFTLPDDVTVYSGHGMPTTIGFEKENNPFVGALAGN
ncbi:MAG: MBL fold metallo-hydrolase [Bacteroidia bacterium]|nr:MBL fold metallo-hydrolase [Bacteroidia bacterium]